MSYMFERVVEWYLCYRIFWWNGSSCQNCVLGSWY